MKKIAIIFSIFIAALFASCDKGDMEVRKLNRGEGIWTIESFLQETYDSVGVNVVSSSEVTDVGEFVFFNNTTLNGLFDEHFVVVNIKDTSGVITAYPGGVYYDDNRAKISTGSGLDGVWTVIDNGRRKQEWAQYVTNPNGGLAVKYTLHIKKK